jgi:hypothetical protein
VGGRERDEQKEGKKNHHDPAIPLEEAHFLLFNLSLRCSQPCGVSKGKVMIISLS